MENCPSCGHEAHGTIQCEGTMDHAPGHWHRCLCLNKPPADKSCPPLMICQGGPLGYTDLWHLQRGQSLQGAFGETITPEALTDMVCPTCNGDRCDPEDLGDWIPEVGRHHPGTRGPCPTCQGKGHVPSCGAGTCAHPAAEHSIYGCVDECGCTWMPAEAAVPCGGDCFEKAAKIVEECDTDPATQYAANALREHAAAMKRTCACGRNPDPGICPITHDGYKGGGHCTCVHEPPKTALCSDPPCGHIEDEECDTHATARAHANGNHQWCDVTCQEEFTWEKLRNTILCRAIPGSAGALDELLRRAANRRALMDAHIALVSTLSQLRAEHAELLHRLEGLEK